MSQDQEPSEPSEPKEETLETRAHKATILGVQLTWKTYVLTAVGVAVAAGGIVLAVSLSSSGTETNIGGDQIHNSDCAKSVNCTVNELKDELKQLEESAGEHDRDLIDELRETANGAPTGKGPWPFVVVNTVAPPLEGLKGRTTPDEVATILGAAHNRAIVWAECIKESAFTPPVTGEENVGPLWLHVTWSNETPDDEGYHTSEPDGPYRSWMYRGYTVPFNHNGKIPAC